MKTLKTKKEQKLGLNDKSLNEAYFPGTGKRQFVGTDDGYPIIVRDETGKIQILTDTPITTEGNVTEQRLTPELYQAMMGGMMNYQDGGTYDKRSRKERKELVSNTFEKYPGLNKVGSEKDFKVKEARGRMKNYLNNNDYGLEYNGKGETLLNNKGNKIGGRNNRKNRIFIDTSKYSDAELQESVSLDMISHGFEGNVENDTFTNKLRNDLVSKYGEEMVINNGGADAYKRGYLAPDDSEEYAPYKKEMEFLGKDYFNEYDSILQSYKNGGYLPKAQMGTAIAGIKAATAGLLGAGSGASGLASGLSAFLGPNTKVPNSYLNGQLPLQGVSSANSEAGIPIDNPYAGQGEELTGLQHDISKGQSENGFNFDQNFLQNLNGKDTKMFELDNEALLAGVGILGQITGNNRRRLNLENNYRNSQLPGKTASYVDKPDKYGNYSNSYLAQDGGMIKDTYEDIELTDAEIEEYRKGGYIVEIL